MVDTHDAAFFKQFLQLQLSAMHTVLCDNGVFLMPNGNEDEETYSSSSESNPLGNMLAVKQAMETIPSVFRRSETLYADGTQTTYGAKHVLADWCKKNNKQPNYITNGDFTAALLLLGYRLQWDAKGPGKLNARFFGEVLPGVLDE